MSLPLTRHGQQYCSTRPARSPRTPGHAERSVTSSTTRQNLYLALYDFVGQSPDQLSFRNGDVVEVIEETNNGSLSLPPAWFTRPLFRVAQTKVHFANIQVRLVVLPKERRLRQRLYTRQLPH